MKTPFTDMNPELIKALKEISEKATLYMENARIAGSNHDMINYAHIVDLANNILLKEIALQ